VSPLGDLSKSNLSILNQSYSSASDASTELLEDLLKESDLLISEVTEALRHSEQEPVDPGFVSSFYLYPRGNAYA
jgi:stress-induced-phosphoprotein 1